MKRKVGYICTLKAGLKLLFLLIVVAQISSAFASTEYGTNIKWEGRLVIPDRIVRIESGISRIEKDEVALSKVGRVEVIGYFRGQCVPFARQKSGNQNVYGMARNIPVNSDSPEINAVVKTNESGLGHVAVVTGETTSTITIVEANYYGSKITKRVLLKSDNRILGYLI